jgi:hypothetical protein
MSLVLGYTLRPNQLLPVVLRQADLNGQVRTSELGSEISALRSFTHGSYYSKPQLASSDLTTPLAVPENSMVYDESLAERVRSVLHSESSIRDNKMFGGLAFMTGGHLFVGIVGSRH